MVTRRLIPLVVALVLALAPAVLEACETRCLSRDVETVTSAPAHHHHSGGAPAATMAGHHHHHATTSQTLAPSGAVMAALPHPCDHGGDLPSATGSVSGVVISPAVAASIVIIPDVQPRLVRGRDGAAAASSPPAALTTQLRL